MDIQKLLGVFHSHLPEDVRHGIGEHLLHGVALVDWLGRSHQFIQGNAAVRLVGGDTHAFDRRHEKAANEVPQSRLPGGRAAEIPLMETIDHLPHCHGEFQGHSGLRNRLVAQKRIGQGPVRILRREFLSRARFQRLDDCLLDRHDSPRGEGLALAVVLQLHGILHAVGDVVFPAEHVGDRLPEGVAGGVVGLFQAAETPHPDADPVAGPGHDGAVGDPADFGRFDAGDRLLLA